MTDEQAHGECVGMGSAENEIARLTDLLQQAEARVQVLEADLAQHGAGKCCKIGKTIVRPDFHIDPDDY